MDTAWIQNEYYIEVAASWCRCGWVIVIIWEISYARL
jgi:hypothetical protein